MSTHTQPLSTQNDAPPGPGHDIDKTHVAHEPAAPISTPMLVAFAIVLVGGAVLIFGRDHFAENAMFDSINGSEAVIRHVLHEKDGSGKYVAIKPNGLAEDYGLVRINKERESVAAYISLCDRVDPAAGLRLFRRAMTEGTKSAKLVAIHSANYLAHSQPTPAPQAEKGVLEASDFKLLLDAMDLKKEPDMDVRKAALHAVSDLTVIVNPSAIAALKADPKAETNYTKVSAAMETAAKDNLDADTKDTSETTKEANAIDRRRDIKVALHKDLVNSKPVLLIRWSTPTLCLAWWAEQVKEGAKWDFEMQRFVIP